MGLLGEGSSALSRLSGLPARRGMHQLRLSHFEYRNAGALGVISPGTFACC